MAEKYTALELRVPGLFEDPAFAAWLNRQAGKGLATWHGEGEPTEMSDVFLVYDHGESGDSPDCPGGMPRHCWDHLCRLVRANGVDYGVLRLVNADGDPSDIPST
jgi:hypothetical protein